MALFWAEELASQTKDSELAAAFAKLGRTLRANEPVITEELLSVQGQPVDLGGYYKPDAAKTTAIMRQSQTFNAALAMLGR